MCGQAHQADLERTSLNAEQEWGLSVQVQSRTIYRPCVPQIPRRHHHSLENRTFDSWFSSSVWCLLSFFPPSDNSLLLFRNQNNKKLETYGLMEENQKDQLGVLHETAFFLFFFIRLWRTIIFTRISQDYIRHDEIIDFAMLLKVWFGTPFSFFSPSCCRTLLLGLSNSLRSDTSAACAAEKNLLYLIFLLKWRLPGFCWSSITPSQPSQDHFLAVAELHSQNRSIFKANSDVFCGPSNTQKWLIQRDGRMNSAIFSTQFVIHHASKMTESLSDYSSGPLLFVKECICPVYIKYAWLCQTFPFKIECRASGWCNSTFYVCQDVFEE